MGYGARCLGVLVCLVAPLAAARTASAQLAPVGVPPGVVRVEVDGSFDTWDHVFRDGTSGKETYEAARFLYADLKADGTTVLDFNQAYNPPCSFNPYTTCPIPPAENRLTVRILAGERDYAGKLP